MLKNYQESVKKWEKIVKTVDTGKYSDTLDVVGTCGYCKEFSDTPGVPGCCKLCPLYKAKVCSNDYSSRLLFWALRNSILTDRVAESWSSQTIYLAYKMLDAVKKYKHKFAKGNKTFFQLEKRKGEKNA